MKQYPNTILKIRKDRLKLLHSYIRINNNNNDDNEA